MVHVQNTSRWDACGLNPVAGLGLFVHGHVPMGGVVAILPGVVYSRTQLMRMPNFPKVRQLWLRSL